MRPRTLLVLLLVVGGLVAFIWLYERELPSSDERAEQAKLLFRFEEEEVNGLEIEREGERAVLERQGRGGPGDEPEEQEDDRARATEWRLVHPLAARADDSLVASLLTSMTSMEKERTLEDMTAAEVGLDEPRARVEVRLEDEAHELLIGSEVPASSTMIVGDGTSDGFYVVADGIWSELSREPGDWRSREVFAAEREDIESISLSRADRRALLARRGDDFWLESPLVDRADEQKVSQLIADITSLTVASFVDYPEQTLEEMGLEPAQAVLEVVLKDRVEPFRLELGGPAADSDGRLTARVGEQVIELDTELPGAMDRSASEWLSTAWSSLETFEIDEIVVADETGTLTLEREGAIWRRSEDEIPFTTASDLLYAITEAEADRILSPAEAGALGADWENPVLELRLAGAEESEREELTLHTGAEGEHLARSGDRESVLVLPAAAVREIRDKIAAARSAGAVASSTDDGP